ncbi:MAG: SOS response-associated peptidase [Dermatophilaceae bacterium]|nr:SOS response-associated peptidase [Intrasporangiaceae bacterium]
MCGRYAASARPDDLVEAFDIDLDATAEPARSVLVSPQSPAPGEPDFNMAPTKQAPVILSRAARGSGSDRPVRQLRHLTWGLVPSWSRDPKVGVRMINARSETVLTSKAYAPAARSRRCLVPARGWYEWQASPAATDTKGRPRKQPFFISSSTSDLIAFAGLYEFWRDEAVEDSADPMAWLTTFTIITTDADPGLDRIHDRQPLVLDPVDWATWLDPSEDAAEIPRLLAFSRAGRFAAYPVSRAVSSSRSNGPHLLDPAGVEELVGVVDPMTGEIIGA